MLQKKIISYSLFGYNKPRQHNCFVFSDYLRGLVLNIRLARLLYPDWIVRLHVDIATMDGLREILTKLPIEIVVCPPAELTKAMLWRMHPVFDLDVDYVICRDLDSPLTYREAQAVNYWVSTQCAAHAITDSISHNIPMMGGMIGFWRRAFKDYTGYLTWEDMINAGSGINYNTKGADQDLLNRNIYPKFARKGSDSIVQHYVLGMADTFLSHFHKKIDDIDIGLPEEYKETNDLCGHIGAAGYYVPPMLRFMQKHKDKFMDIQEVEKDSPDIFFWTNDGI